MTASKTFFEQIPIETVKSIAREFPEESAMCCRLCNSENQRKFATEIAVHLPGLSTPHVLLFPKVLVCLRCGFTEFSIPETELPRLEQTIRLQLKLATGDWANSFLRRVFTYPQRR